MTTTCHWCQCDPRAPMPGGVSPHSTWCPRYTPPRFPPLPADLDSETGCADDKLPGTADDWRKPLQQS